VRRRSRERGQRILVAAEQIVAAGGVDALTTRAVALGRGGRSGRAREDVLARQFHTFAIAAGLLEPSPEPFALSLAFELADRFMEVVHRHDLDGEDRIVKEGIEVVPGHLERYATPAGISGIDAGEPAARSQAPVLDAPAVAE
jgi:hypothetical protein